MTTNRLLYGGTTMFFFKIRNAFQAVKKDILEAKNQANDWALLLADQNRQLRIYVENLEMRLLAMESKRKTTKRSKRTVLLKAF